MAGYGQAKLVRGINRQLQLVIIPDLDLAFAALARDQSGDMDLDPVDPAFGLLADFGDDLVLCPRDFQITDRALIGHQHSGGSANRGKQRIAPACHARAFAHAALNRVTQVERDIIDGIRVEQAGDTGTQYFLDVVRRDQCRESLAPMEEQLIVGMGLIKADVAMRIDQPGHHRAAAGIDPIHVIPACRPIQRGLPRRNNLAIERNGLDTGRCAGGIEQ